MLVCFISHKAYSLFCGDVYKRQGAIITYMRTDSLRISDEAKAAAAQMIESTYGKEYLPSRPRVFKSKNNAQDAHEAIRPTIITLTPEKVKSALSGDQYKLYKQMCIRDRRIYGPCRL